jgi:hypothetical protein
MNALCFALRLTSIHVRRARGLNDSTLTQHQLDWLARIKTRTSYPTLSIEELTALGYTDPSAKVDEFVSSAINKETTKEGQVVFKCTLW